jgi:hypothetical protein
VTPNKFSGVKNSATVTLISDDQLKRYQNWLRYGTLIQEALPELSKDQREILMSGIGQQEWDRLFPPEEE